MTANGWFQIAFFLLVVLAITKPIGVHMARVFSRERTFLDPVLRPVERSIYRVVLVDENREMRWTEYAVAMLLFSVVSMLVLYLLQRVQLHLPFNPQKLGAVPPPLAFNTAASFTTNTNWQNYSGETTMSYLTQMAGLAYHNFASAAVGIAVAVAFIRGVARHEKETIGNFWVDLTRGYLWVLMPVCVIGALVLVWQGVPQNLKPYDKVKLTEPMQVPKVDASGRLVFGPDGMQLMDTVSEQTIAQGPVASQEIIKEFGTNGGGFFNANSSHPYENPTPLSNMVEIFLILLVSGGLTHTFGRMAGNPRQGWALLAVMLAVLIFSMGALYRAEAGGNPLVAKLGVSGFNMEGKETRFGLAGSALFAVSTTGTSCGAVNAMHDSLTPLGGMMPLSLILLSEVVFGGVGTGLYTMLAFVVIAVFVAGLMIGRTPEFLGKKIEVREMWMSIITVLTSGILILVFSGIAMIVPSAVASMSNPGAHGLSEVFYAFASMSNNNGSAFAGLNGNTVFYNVTGAFCMFMGRFAPIVASLAMAGSLAEKKYVPPSLGTLPTDKVPFALWLTLVILIVGALTFFPALSLGPIVEHLIMLGGK